MRQPVAPPRQVTGAYLLAMPPAIYHRRWDVYLRGERIGMVFAATEKAACLRAIHRFEVRKEDRRELEVRRAATTSELHIGQFGVYAPRLIR